MHTTRALAALLILVSGTACEAGHTSEELFQPGPYRSGHREASLTYSAAASGADRELPIRVWYPASPDATEGPARYIAVDGVVALPSGQALDAPTPASDGPFPVVVYSHGSGGDNLLAYPYAELFASHGWVVVAPAHVGNTAADGLNGTDAPFLRVTLERPHDIRATLDWLESGLAGDPLEGVADTSRVFLFGHSFGGYTTLAAAGADLDVDAMLADCEGQTDPSCAVLDDPAVVAAFRAGLGDPRIDAIAPQAPGLVPLFAEGELASIEVPTLLMTGLLDQTTTQEEQAVPAWAGLDHPDDLWVQLPTGAHFSFITICHDLAEEVLLLFRPGAPMDGCGPEFIPSTEAVPALGAYLLGFARQHVLGESFSSVLTGPPLHDAMNVTTH